MKVLIIIFAVSCLIVWKESQRMNEYQSLKKRRILFMPILQFLFCGFYCFLSLQMDNSLSQSQDEIGSFLQEHKVIGGLTTFFFGIDLEADQVMMSVLIDNLHTVAIYVLIGSTIMTFIQIFGAYNCKIDRWIVEGISVVHTICCAYIGNMLCNVLVFFMWQDVTIKLLSNTSKLKDGFSVLLIFPAVLIALHYLYHKILDKRYEVLLQKPQT